MADPTASRRTRRSKPGDRHEAPGPSDRDASGLALARIGARVVRRGTAEYPVALDDLPDAPPEIFVRGALPQRERAVAIVGSRAASAYGLEQAARIAADLAGLGVVVVSGLARGIDAAAHRGALEAQGLTVAVLPGALDAIVPVHHRPLAGRIATSGGWVSEIAPGTTLVRAHFVRRNRLIAALTAATVVVQAAERSGALATAWWARRLGRPLFAVPGDVDRIESRGCHALIKQGARLCESAGDVARVLDPAARPGVESRLIAALGELPRALEDVARDAGAGLDEALAALLTLEWNGLARSFPGQRWGRAGEGS